MYRVLNCLNLASGERKPPWMAALGTRTPGLGWAVKGQLPPWVAHYNGATRFVIATSMPFNFLEDERPPSLRNTTDLLTEFYTLNNFKSPVPNSESIYGTLQQPTFLMPKVTASLDTHVTTHLGYPELVIRTCLLRYSPSDESDLEILNMIVSYVESHEERSGSSWAGPDIDVAVWTDYPQSFFEEDFSGTYREITTQVPRSDLLRHRFNFRLGDPEYIRFGWQPFGYATKEQIEPELWPGL
ncbi:hypothetical protein BJ875DRAFT_446985 [Amylocarpus encephaloides]|uniref:Uncharacterized protein n=1 Tax=Amylocarpus encephaloides TaxID=45428 RepID=A0A9P7Y8D1_9HELO|nr:hypothetical protein BJ875DRAFT_446985 [Amylocarpus encephaloides]